MRMLASFLEAARQNFEESGLPGEFCGVDVIEGRRDQRAFFVHSVDGKIQKTEWLQAIAHWSETCTVFRQIGASSAKT